MSWGRNRRVLMACAGAALVAGTSATALASVLVVRATGPSARTYPAGRQLPDNARIQLQAGDQLVVLGSAGTRTFRGPGTYSPSAPLAAGQPGVTRASGRRARIGATRGPIQRNTGTIWHVEPSAAGKHCVPGLANVMLWRADATGAATLSLRGPTGATRTLQFAAGEHEAAWPRGLTLRSGAEYQLSWQGEPAPVRVQVHVIPGPANPAADAQATARALIQHGCQAQLDDLIAHQSQ